MKQSPTPPLKSYPPPASRLSLPPPHMWTVPLSPMTTFPSRCASSLWATCPTPAPYEVATRTPTFSPKIRHLTKRFNHSTPPTLLSSRLFPLCTPQRFWPALPPPGPPPFPFPSRPTGRQPSPSNLPGLQTPTHSRPPRPQPSNQPPALLPQRAPSPGPTLPDPLSSALTQSVSPRTGNLSKPSKNTKST
ncbi:hypothetical protein QBC39DRAFT_12373 [Podospora conica]|nr:hypothetical protein QBC39DRAFT_12373 [Schizothecium conicum]